MPAVTAAEEGGCNSLEYSTGSACLVENTFLICVKNILTR